MLWVNVCLYTSTGLHHSCTFSKIGCVCQRVHAVRLVHADVAWEQFSNHSSLKYLNIILISNSPSLSLTAPSFSLLSAPSCSLYLPSLFHMLTLWLGICWPPGGLNQSRASFTESAHTCPDRNDNDHGQSPPLCHAATEMCLFWNARSDVRGEALHFDGWELKVSLKGESLNSTLDYTVYWPMGNLLTSMMYMCIYSYSI